jgi:DNA polymerase III subunit gamma/tau
VDQSGLLLSRLFVVSYNPMSYQVFARKYRPQTFADVVGQDHITRTLQNAIKQNRIAQAYLFVGPRGTGKTSTARILAKALNCAEGPKAEFDPNEEICLEIAEGRCLDVLEIDGASNNSVEQVRDLRDNVRYAPARGRYKIYIIDEVHMLSTAAFNALLKTLEEPPAHVKFIFATTEAHKLPATILSRCQRFDLRRIPEKDISGHLQKICGLEKAKAEPAALAAIARYAEGGLRDAESALDQIISFFGDNVTEADVLSMFGLTGLGPIIHLSRSIVTGDIVAVLSQSRELVVAGKDLGKLSQDLLRFFRNLAVYQVSPEAMTDELTAEESHALAEIGALISRPGVMAILEDLSHLENRLRYALAKDVIFEVALMQLSQLKEKVSLESILQKISGEGTPGRAAPPVPAPSPAQRPELKSPASATAQPAVNPETAWKTAVEKFAADRPMEAATIRAIRYVACKSGGLDVALPPALKNKLPYLMNARNLPLLEASLQESFGRPMKLTFLLVEPKETETKSGGIEAAPSKVSQGDFENDPLIREALQMFQARVVSVQP